MSNINEKVGCVKVERSTVDCGLGTRNDKGNRLIQFCLDKNLMIAYTLFRLPETRFYM